MIENANNCSSEENKKIVGKIVDDMTLFDDTLMSRVFTDNIDATELVLRIILGKEIKVIKVDCQYEIKNAYVGGRSIKLDVHAIDKSGKELNIEVQGDAEGSHVRRARYYSSMLDTKMLKKGQKFKELKDSYVIFMYKQDKFGSGLPMYHIHRTVEETNASFEDGSHIIYVNGEYKADDDIGRLISDFHQVEPDDMHFEELAAGLKHYKISEGGRKDMCESVERYAEKCVDESNAVNVKNLMSNLKLNMDQALNALNIQGDARANVIRRLQKQ